MPVTPLALGLMWAIHCLRCNQGVTPCRCRYYEVTAGIRAYSEVVSVVEQAEEPHLRMFIVDDARLWERRQRPSLEELAIEGVSDEEWSDFYEALAEE